MIYSNKNKLILNFIISKFQGKSNVATIFKHGVKKATKIETLPDFMHN